MKYSTLTENTFIEKEGSGLVPALDRTLDILETLSEADAGMTLSALSQELQLPKNAVFRITQTLLARGYLYRNEKSMAFSVTPKLLRLVSSRGKRPSISDAAKPHMQELRDLTRETIQLGVMSGREGVIIDQVEGLEPLRIVVDIGLRFLSSL